MEELKAQGEFKTFNLRIVEVGWALPYFIYTNLLTRRGEEGKPDREKEHIVALAEANKAAAQAPRGPVFSSPLF